VGLVVIWFISGALGRAAVENDATIRGANAALAIGQAHRAHEAKLAAISQAHADSARSWHRGYIVRGGLIAQLDTAVDRSATKADSLLALLVVRDSLRAQVLACCSIAHQWEIAYRADSTRADLAQARNSELEQHLRGVLTIADCHILGASWLPKCPSRTASFLIGGGTGGVLALVLGRH